jgi:SAM-dependent methyltransferase
MNLSKRSYQKELLDRDDIPFDDIKQNMKELDFINTTLGGHGITLEGLKQVIKTSGHLINNGELSILEIGCGGGDNLRVIKNYCSKKNIPVQLIGVDINPHCIQFAASRKENEGIKFFASDYRLFNPEKKPAVIFSSLFCHHFTDEQVIEILEWMKNNSTLGFFINDLHRHFLAYHSIKWLTKFFSKSYLVKNDAPLSVERGFKRNEWGQFLKAAGIIRYSLMWKWAFRWLLIVQN